jgi:hypothetical protein
VSSLEKTVAEAISFQPVGNVKIQLLDLKRRVYSSVCLCSEVLAPDPLPFLIVSIVELGSCTTKWFAFSKQLGRPTFPTNPD